MFTMYDSTDVDHLPAGADAYAGYVGGHWPTWVALQARFKGTGAHLLSIAISPDEHALCLDIEQGDAQPWQAPAWVKTEHLRSVHRPVLYASASKMPAVMAHLHDHGIDRTTVRLWSAHYGAGKHICGPATCKLTPAMDGTQWTDDAPGAAGSTVDESLLADDFFTVPPPPPPPPVELYGYLVTQGSVGNVHAFAGRAVTSHDAGRTWG